MTDQLLWFATRGAGVVSLLLASGVVVLGLLTTARWQRPGWPRFLTAELHRTVALVSVVFTALHVVTAIVDPYAQLGILAAIVPLASSLSAGGRRLGRPVRRTCCSRSPSRACCAIGSATGRGRRSTGSPTRAGRSPSLHSITAGSDAIAAVDAGRRRRRDRFRRRGAGLPPHGPGVAPRRPRRRDDRSRPAGGRADDRSSPRRTRPCVGRRTVRGTSSPAGSAARAEGTASPAGCPGGRGAAGARRRGLPGRAQVGVRGVAAGRRPSRRPRRTAPRASRSARRTGR